SSISTTPRTPMPTSTSTSSAPTPATTSSCRARPRAGHSIARGSTRSSTSPRTASPVCSRLRPPRSRRSGAERGPALSAAGRIGGRLVVATRSPHKLRELRELLALDGTALVSLEELGVEGDPVEDGLTFETNALIKARFAARATGLPALADDSGLEVDALGGRPGVHTRRYAGPEAGDAENNAKLLVELAGVPPERRTARYVCVLALAQPDADRRSRGGLEIVTRRGTTRGRIALT